MSVAGSFGVWIEAVPGGGDVPIINQERRQTTKCTRPREPLLSPEPDVEKPIRMYIYPNI
jgi:hypothetical protein